jgi:hypothetical protein
MIILSHAILQHISPLLNEQSEESACTFVLGVLVDVGHQQDYLFAHDGALDCGTAVIEEVALVFFYCLVGTVF